jgi:DNA-binding LacI/PurR family transcriptional regulator
VQVPRLLLRQDILDGFVLAGIHSQNLIELLSRTSGALAVLGNNILRPWNEVNYDAVWYDDVEGGYQMTRHMLALGHQDIWFVGNRQFPWFDRCYDGYSRAMSEAGLLARAVAPDCERPREAGYLGTQSLLAEHAPVTAIVAGSDATAQGVCDAIREAGLRVPADISVGGLDDIEAATMHPRLASVHIPLEEVGAQLAACVISRVETPRDIRRVLVPTTLVEGESCAPRGRVRRAPTRPRRVQAR